MIALDHAVLCLALVIYHEARSEPPLVQLAVASVVVNRAEQSAGTLCDVAMAPSQFHVPWQPADDDRAWQAAQTLAYNVLRFEPPDPTGGAVHFSHGAEHPYWARGMQRYPIGAMNFWTVR